MSRPPTSHERRSGRSWDDSYQGGPAPWDLDRPQPAVVRLAEQGAFAGAVLDAGCGTGENALWLAASGLGVVGFDVAPTALAAARAKAVSRGLEVRFVVGDALELRGLGGPFDTVLDCGLLHTFDSAERLRYLRELASVTEPDGVLHVLCFADRPPAPGPHPLSEADLRATFSPAVGWIVERLEPEHVQTRFHEPPGAPAWLATARRTARSSA
ncbi:transferase [Kineosporia sp. NBRC 101677]|uniref:class I SAM-dependent methyltransferase n=1 Tax=Kineosporia sp. NBRC 101677 TaxID=3032197 RepID=UPI0024A125DD|nr:class I SAM-dependent methyltransferase [Kineosporia sp. NBRC 101677]GLY20225.1 transferase [Kineosporia sp. NBRC 101677]